MNQDPKVRLEHLDPLHAEEKEVKQGPLVLLDLQEHLDLEVKEGSLENVVNLGRLDNQEHLANVERLVLRDPQDLLDHQDLLELLEQEVNLDKEENLDPEVKQGHQDHRVCISFF